MVLHQTRSIPAQTAVSSDAWHSSSEHDTRPVVECAPIDDHGLANPGPSSIDSSLKHNRGLRGCHRLKEGGLIGVRSQSQGCDSVVCIVEQSPRQEAASVFWMISVAPPSLACPYDSCLDRLSCREGGYVVRSGPGLPPVTDKVILRFLPR